MPAELNLRFPDPDHVVVSCDGEDSGTLPFASPLTAKDRQDLRWYLEVYGAHSLGDPDDGEARRIAAQLSAWGKRLFEAVFSERAAERIFNRFQDAEDDARLLTISAEHPTILALPWELLHDPASGGVFLFREISIRRRLAGAGGGRKPFQVQSKDRLHLLFVVSRPDGAGFLDPRADASAVLDALDEHAPGRCTWEFLRAPTLDALVARLGDEDKPPIDILHFDGHGVFDPHGGLPERLADRKLDLAQVLAGALLKDTPGKPSTESPPNTGYLLFETADGGGEAVPAEKLGLNLHRRRVPLVILSACQSGTQGQGEEPLGSVAARLTAAGIPAVLAMTHSVLVPTTRSLFGEFYEQLARHRAIGEALDAARLHLHNHPEKYTVQRGPERMPLRLFDWFVPSLYQSGADVPLLRAAKAGKEHSAPEVIAPRTNLPTRPESGFFGRRRELWEIERRFAAKTRRMTLTGFGGQGKTALALEAGHWLTRTGLFDAAVFVNYAHGQAADAVAVAVSQIGSVLGASLPDARSAEEALRRTATLVILDNLESVPAEPLRELLGAAKGWSESGGTRVLLTTRTPDFGHPDYRVESTNLHRRILLAGLGSQTAPDDALEWFAELSKFPPAPEITSPSREALIELFDQVRFHPLSIRVLAQQLKTRRPAELGERLGQLLAAHPTRSSRPEDTPPELLASLELSLDRLDKQARAVLPRLGVFQGGAFEYDLIAITGLGEDQAGQASAVWPTLRRQLESAALLEAETVPRVVPPFLRFHPTLAPMLWEQLAPDERMQLTTAHRQRYQQLAGYVYWKDGKNPHDARAVARRELPNLLHAVDAAFAAQDPDAVDFADRVTRFLNIFGLPREARRLTSLSQAAAGLEGSRAWVVAQSNRGEQLFGAGRANEAAELFRRILDRLGDAPSYERAVTLGHLGRCFQAGGRPDRAEQCHREGIAVTARLELSDTDLKKLTSALHTDLADVLVATGQYAEAREEYEASLRIDKEVDDVRGQGVVLGQLGTLALREGKVGEAEDRYRAALTLFRQLGEPGTEAVYWHQLGMVYENGGQWEESERHYREAARLRENLGLIGGFNGAAATWNHLANVSRQAGKPEAAEQWYHKAIDAARSFGDKAGLLRSLNNLAILLHLQASRLPEARTLAEEALGIAKTLEPAGAEIWRMYNLLAAIAEQEAAGTTDSHQQAELLSEAREHRRLAREHERNFTGTRQALKPRLPLIAAAVMASLDPAKKQLLEEALAGYGHESWNALCAAIRRIVAGERDEDLLQEGQLGHSPMIITTILAALADPSTLEALLPPDSEVG